MNKETKEKIIVFALCFVLVFTLYGQTIAGDFVFDDRALADHVSVLRLDNFLEVVSMPYWHVEQGLYRPTVLLSYVLNYSVFGNGAWSFHLVNLILYALTGCLIFVFLQRLFSKKSLSCLASFLFLVLPIHTEAVANIIGRAEILALLFSLLVLLELLKEKTSSWKICLFFFLALGGKEVAIAILPVAFVVIFLSKKEYWPFLYLVLGAVFYFFGRFFALGTDIFSTHPGVVENPLVFVPFLPRIITALKILTLYLSKTFWPFGLCSDYSYNQIAIINNFWNAETLIGLAVLIFSALAVLFFLGRKPPFSLASAFFLFGFLPVSNLILPFGTIAGERLMFFSSLGICIFSAEIFLLFPKKFYLAPLFLLLAFYGWRSYQRNFDWLTEKALFASAVQCAPNSVLSRSNMGAVYYFDKNYEAAEKEFLASQKIYDKYPMGINNLGLVYWKTGRYKEAKERFLRALTVENPYVGAYENLALMAIEKKNTDEARKWLNFFFNGNKEAVENYLSRF